MESTIKPFVDLFKKPSITEVEIVFETLGVKISETLMLGLEKSTDRLYVFEWHVSNEGTPSEVGDWMPGRFLTFEGNSWVSRHTSPPVKFKSYEEITKYWNENMVLHPMPPKGTKEYEDSILNSYISEMSEGMASLSHVG
ncbi:uncharacterized protein METZ01_LOCUS181921 [marine metagenome]|uniref:Uncharacterized protein n=1 Tax=marine metagenome TaxID=408172 RepID=A0A382CUS0_9ZZZZ|tara:strand:+ start:50 stop:469 length:420 start_codon:yes stop_codon:yes gene_type:complete